LWSTTNIDSCLALFPSVLFRIFNISLSYIVNVGMHEQTSHDALFAILALLLGLTTAWLAGNLPFENIELAEFFHGIWSE
jgi:hypothetical protein